MSSLRLDDRRGLVLGVSNAASVGFHCVRDLKAQGGELAFSYRPQSERAASAVARELESLAVPIDVLDDASIRSGIERVGEHYQRLDFLVHALVHVPEGSLQRPLLDLTRDEFALALEVGARSLLSTMRYALPWLGRSKAPRVVVLLSQGGEFAMPNYHVIGIAKAALTAALRYLASELGSQGVLCNAVSFSILDTQAARNAVGESVVARTRQYLEKRSMTGVALEFGHVTNAVAFLASDACQNITGEVVTVDGGYSRNYF